MVQITNVVLLHGLGCSSAEQCRTVSTELCVRLQNIVVCVPITCNNVKRSLPWYQQRLVGSNEIVLSPLKKEDVPRRSCKGTVLYNKLS